MKAFFTMPRGAACGQNVFFFIHGRSMRRTGTARVRNISQPARESIRRRYQPIVPPGQGEVMPDRTRIAPVTSA